jgi:hypothetical protein
MDLKGLVETSESIYVRDRNLMAGVGLREGGRATLKTRIILLRDYACKDMLKYWQ